MSLVATRVVAEHEGEVSTDRTITCSCDGHDYQHSIAEFTSHLAEAAVSLAVTSAGAAVLRVRDHPRASWRDDMEIQIPASASEQGLAESMALIAFAQSAARLVDADGLPRDLTPVAT